MEEVTKIDAGPVDPGDWRSELSCENSMRFCVGFLEFALCASFVDDPAGGARRVSLRDAGYGVDSFRSESVSWVWDRVCRLVDEWCFVLADACRVGPAARELGWLAGLLRDGWSLVGTEYDDACWLGAFRSAVESVFGRAAVRVDEGGFVVIEG